MDPYSTEKPPAYGQQQVAYGQPVQGQPMAYGQQPMQGQPMAYGQPTQGQPMAYGQPTQGQPMAYGQPMQGQPMAYGQPMQGQPMAYGQQPMQGQPMAYGQQPMAMQQMPVGQPAYSQQAMPVGQPTLTTAPQSSGRWNLDICGFGRDCDSCLTCVCASFCAPCVLWSNLNNMGISAAGGIFIYFPLWCVWGWLQNPGLGHDDFSDCEHTVDRDGRVSELCSSRTAYGLAALCWFFLSMIAGYYRTQIRQKYGVTSSVCGMAGNCDDVIVHMFCSPCALTQENYQYRTGRAVQEISFHQ